MTYLVTDSNKQRFVLRRPPIGNILESAHDMGREFKIISCLGPTDIPVAPALGLCRDKSVNDADFYVMGYVEGEVFEDSVDAQKIPMEKRFPIGFELVDTMVRLHRIDPEKVGLGDLGPRTNYAERQVRRWVKQWENSKAENVKDIEDVGQWLKKNIPAQPETTIVHGDFRLGNFILKNHSIAAVLDWELCTLGNPLADIAWLLNWWATADEVEVELGKGDQAPTAVGGFASRQELLEHYRKKSGRDLTAVNYFRALSHWKLAIITQGVYQRFLDGSMGKTGERELYLFKQSFQRCARLAKAMIN
jgi:aminoglycoside phosphotransferase (APT) family kinase protein